MAGSVAVKPARAVYRGYFSNDRRRSALVKRLHVIRDTPVRGRSEQYPVTWCGQSAGPHRDSDPVVLSPMPLVLPAGLGWCPKCIGHLAEYFGLLDEVAASLVAYDPELSR
jgi:hypothetical protein